jgi:microcompartment protein CcmL/EutN
VDSVEVAVEAGIDVLEGTGLVLSHAIIPSPTDEISRSIL